MKTPRETKRISFRTDVECNSSRSRLICRECKQESEAVGIYAGTDVMCRRRKEVEGFLGSTGASRLKPGWSL